MFFYMSKLLVLRKGLLEIECTLVTTSDTVTIPSPPDKLKSPDMNLFALPHVLSYRSCGMVAPDSSPFGSKQNSSFFWQRQPSMYARTLSPYIHLNPHLFQQPPPSPGSRLQDRHPRIAVHRSSWVLSVPPSLREPPTPRGFVQDPLPPLRAYSLPVGNAWARDATAPEPYHGHE